MASADGHAPSKAQDKLSALRDRVEALEGGNRDLAHSLAASRADHTTLCRLVDALWDGTDDAAGALSDEQRRLLPMCRDLARAALQPDKGERLSQQERDTLAEARATVESAQATREEMDRKYDKREAICVECESDPSVTPGTCECPGHRDVSNVRPARTARRQPDKGERCETCGGTRWLDPRAEHAPCPDCKEDVR